MDSKFEPLMADISVLSGFWHVKYINCPEPVLKYNKGGRMYSGIVRGEDMNLPMLAGNDLPNRG